MRVREGNGHATSARRVRTRTGTVGAWGEGCWKVVDIDPQKVALSRE